MNYFIIDTETTGLPDYKNNRWPKLVSVAIVHGVIENGDMNIYYENEWYVTDWVEELDENLEKFLGITKQQIKRKGKTFEQVKSEIENYLAKYPIRMFVAHNANFDRNVLRYNGLDLANEKWYCTMRHSFLMFNKYLKLKEMAERFSIPVEEGNLHTALYDAQLCSYIFYCLLSGTNKKSIKIENLEPRQSYSRILSLRNRDMKITF